MVRPGPARDRDCALALESTPAAAREEFTGSRPHNDRCTVAGIARTRTTTRTRRRTGSSIRGWRDVRDNDSVGGYAWKSFWGGNRRIKANNGQPQYGQPGDLGCFNHRFNYTHYVRCSGAVYGDHPRPRRELGRDRGRWQGSAIRTAAGGERAHHTGTKKGRGQGRKRRGRRFSGQWKTNRYGRTIRAGEDRGLWSRRDIARATLGALTILFSSEYRRLLPFSLP
jgi:hypothetical protein